MGRNLKEYIRVKKAIRPMQCFTRVVYPDGSSFSTVLPWVKPTITAQKSPTNRDLNQLFITDFDLQLKNWKGVKTGTELDSSAVAKFQKRFGQDDEQK
mmetsp:Transcript_12576/g.38450  ORF Transcript_12576/g.38450 Transcript_12576/m.38450 type:complete len:98 (-) Transcript_12576:1526-1819(-)